MSPDEIGDKKDLLDGLLGPSQRRRKPASDALDGLLGPSQRGRDQVAPDAAPSPRAAPRGLNPLDLLSLPTAQRELINWLSRRDQARFEEIQQALGKEPQQIAETLAILKEAGYTREALVDGQIYYRIVFGGAVHRAGRGLSKDIWNLLELDNASFLQQVPLFQPLPRPEIERIAGKLEERSYARNEVILWQGAPIDHLCLVKRGIVGIAHLSSQEGTPKVLAYVKQGEVLGEVGMLVAQRSTTTATALSEVQLLLMKRQDFFDLLNEHGDTAIELARVMGQRLAATNARLSSSATETHLCLLVGVGAGCTTLGSAIALTLAQVTKGQTVYTEYPVPDQLPGLFGFTRETEVYHHPAGYDVVVPRSTPGLPANVRATLVLDQLVSSYANVVIGLPGGVGEQIAYMLERADQVIVLSPPDPASWARAMDLSASMKTAIHPEKTGLFTAINREIQEHDAVPAPGRVNFDLPFLATAPSLAELRHDNLPESLARMAKALADSLGRTNQIGVYIPTTIGVDEHADTTAYIEKTLAFLGRLFGGATSKQAQGVWNSEEAGLVREDVYIVQSFVTQSDLDRCMPEVVEYVEWLKQELKQEAMALEVNQKLILI